MGLYDGAGTYKAACRQYEQEVKDRWGDTPAYRENEMRTMGDIDRQQAAVDGLIAVFGAFAAEAIKVYCERYSKKMHDYFVHLFAVR